MGDKSGAGRKGYWLRIWYMVCFLALGIIDQRRGSAAGAVQMTAANMVGIVLAAMLVPSLDKDRFRHRIYMYWSALAALGGTLAAAWGWQNWLYKGQWLTGVANVVVWGYLVIYLIRGWKELAVKEKLLRPFPLGICAMLLWMTVSVHEGIVPLWYLLLYVCWYIIGIPKENRRDYFQGLLNGTILWFFVQQGIAFGFRPYDYVRYRGLYAGETQNGLFYMIAYCAFICKWLWLKQEKKNRLLACGCFLMAAVCVSFTLYTGGRAPVLGIGMASAVAYIWYYLVCRKSFYRLLGRGILFVLCIAISFPVVYKAIRYFPTILHHPIWFEGEYSEEKSVRSFDPPDSERYISFEKAFDENIGRMLSALGINWYEWKDRIKYTPWGMKVFAKEAGEPGDTPENPFRPEGIDYSSSVGVRKVIYTYYCRHLNLLGHSRAAGAFYISEGEPVVHAHNMFLQMAYDYGIPAGILFVYLYLYSIYWTLKCCGWESKVQVVFLVAILVFGFFEMAVVLGQITLSLLGIMFCLVGKEKELPNKSEVPKTI